MVKESSHTKFPRQKILLLWLLSLALMVLLFLLYSRPNFIEEHRNVSAFDKMLNHLFQDEMLSNTLSMHYTLAHPDTYGIEDYIVNLPPYQKNNLEETKNSLSLYLKSFSSIDSNSLSREDAYLLNLFTKSFENRLALCEYPYFEEPLSPSSGIQSQLPILLADYTFRGKRDVEDYLELLTLSGDYLVSLLEYEKEKKAAVTLLPKASLEETARQCYSLITEEALSTNSHFLQTTFLERLTPLLDKALITPTEAADYTKKNDYLLATLLRPAYETLGEGLFALSDETIPLAGLSSKEGGQEYYKLLLFRESGSSRSVEEITRLLLSQLKTTYSTLATLINENPSLSSPSKNPLEDFPLESAAAMLADLQKRSKEDFPSLPLGKDDSPKVILRSVSKSLSSFCAPAFYLTPPLDDTSANTIYINEEDSPDPLELYTILAHEGYPGHLYETVWHNRTNSTKENGYARELLHFGGYVEGWALYTEFISFDYASQLLRDNNHEEAALLTQLEKQNLSLELCLLSLLDIYIHYYDYSLEEVTTLLTSFGLSDESTIQSIYKYIVEEPCNYLKYYLGYLEILSLQKEAKTLWASAYNNKRFHEFILEYGPADFQSLHDALLATTSSLHP